MYEVSELSTQQCMKMIKNTQNAPVYIKIPECTVCLMSGVLTLCVIHCFVCHTRYLQQINEASHYRNNDCYTIKTITRYCIDINTNKNTVYL